MFWTSFTSSVVRGPVLLRHPVAQSTPFIDVSQTWKQPCCVCLQQLLVARSDLFSLPNWVIWRRANLHLHCLRSRANLVWNRTFWVHVWKLWFMLTVLYLLVSMVKCQCVCQSVCACLLLLRRPCVSHDLLSHSPVWCPFPATSQQTQ